MKFLHIAAAIVWLGGVVFMLFALRPAASNQLEPPQRLPLVAEALRRFFAWVWVSVAVLLGTGLSMMLSVGMKNAPLGWHVMFALGLLMFAIFGHLYFGPFRRLRRAVSTGDWTEGARRLGQIATLSGANLIIGAVAIAAVVLLAR